MHERHSCLPDVLKKMVLIKIVDHKWETTDSLILVCNLFMSFFVKNNFTQQKKSFTTCLCLIFGLVLPPLPSSLSRSPTTKTNAKRVQVSRSCIPSF